MHKHNVKSDQNGLVSIIVTIIIMIVLSLIVLGFAKVSRREQRQSLDRQLTSQAYYAAETGINDAQKYIKDQLALPSPPPPSAYTFTQCQGPASFTNVSGISNVVNGTTSYSCVLVDPSPEQLIWQRINANNSLAFPFKPSGPITGMTFSWQDADTLAANYGGCPGALPALPFVPQTSWTCQAGALRVDVTPVSGAVDRAGLISNTKNFILYPLNGGPSTFAYGSVGKGDIIPVGCAAVAPTPATPRHCNLTLTGLPSGDYFVRIRPVYRAAVIEMAAVPTAGTVTLTDAQAVIDVTGKANDILKRTQARASISRIDSITDNTTLDYTIQSVDSLCKQYAIIPPSTVTPTNSTPDSSCTFP